MPRVVVRKGYRCLPGKRRDLLAALQRVDAVAAEAGWPRGRYLFVETKAPGEPDVEVEFTFESYGEMEQLERRLREHLARAPQGAASIGSAGQEFLLEPSSTRYLLLLDEAAAAGSSPSRRAAEPQAAADTGEAAPAPAVAAPGARAARPPVQGVPTPAPMPPSPQPAIQRRQGYGPPPSGAPVGSATDRIRPAAGAPSAPSRPAVRPVERIEDIERDVDGLDELEEAPPEEDLSALSPAERRLQQLAEARAALSKAEDTVNVSPEQRARARQIVQRNPESD